MLKRRSVLAATAGWTIVGASAVRAQAWPSQQVKIVVPYIPGGATDTAGRIVAEKFGALLGQQVIVENRGGGNTIIGMEVAPSPSPMATRFCSPPLSSIAHFRASVLSTKRSALSMCVCSRCL